ncbi:MAG: NAD(P)H-hydrate dehydratase [Parcubacteria group bacterium CG11_big_fil_rev_8_21_14_0_20_39_14]|nr:MAG: NAD(P)H-hydrate dehydratase [Parcubacteria group bacterium CG11_big_fil_rev_8_21_14_0_20_39_14]PIS35094.1 MAG: NAD(P)H-hydrate dehydratase [Parcubacteria group bacterium CG08_land_8_20_14_0_20_38_56]
MNLSHIYPPRSAWTHKGEHGHVLILAGSKRYSGSPVFNAISALRAGADLIHCVGPERAMNIAAGFLPDIITVPLPGDILRPKHIAFILKLASKFDSIILGSGLGRASETFKAIQEIVAKIDLPMAIDADGIRALAPKKEIIKGKNIVLTPHLVEFEILTGQKVKSEVEDRKEKVKKWAENLGCTILLKGHIDVISDGKEVAVEKAGSPYMTAGGMGDTLTGILGAILARKVNPWEAAQAAAFINGKAGELAAKKYGEGVLASDIFDFIPEVIKKYT